MKITDREFLHRMIFSRPYDLPGFFARRIHEGLRPAPDGLATSYFADVRFDVNLSFHALARKYYFHTHEMFLERIFRKHLRKETIFFDIGANLGYWSAFCLPLVGKFGEVHAFEPVPQFYESLKALTNNNPGYHLKSNLTAIGAAPAILPMRVVEPTKQNFNNFEINIGSSSLAPGFLAKNTNLTRYIEVEVKTLDSYITSNSIDLDRIGLIKIDVEGFEDHCFLGMKEILAKRGQKVPILCEVLTDEDRGLRGMDIVNLLKSFGYNCLDAITLGPIDTDKMQFEENILCV